MGRVRGESQGGEEAGDRQRTSPRCKFTDETLVEYTRRPPRGSGHFRSPAPLSPGASLEQGGGECPVTPGTYSALVAPFHQHSGHSMVIDVSQPILR